MVNVSKRFPGTLALDSVDLTIARGQVHALVGQNGSGKSTLIKILAGYYLADEGSKISIDGTPVAEGQLVPQEGTNLRFVHQGLGLIDEMDAVDNIAIAGGYVKGGSRKIDWRRQRARTRELLAQLGLDIDVRQPAGEVGAVERTSIAIARALAGMKPGRGLLVLDEPSVALDGADTARLFEIVRRLADQGVAILYVSHYLDEVFAISDQVTVLRDGRRIASRPTSSITKHELIELMVGQSVDLVGTGADVPDATSSPTVLDVRGLSGADLKGLDLEVRAGEIVGIAGTSGSGRTELPLALVGATRASAGTMAVDGQEISSPWTPRSVRTAGLALVPADRRRHGSHAQFSMRENVTLADLSAFRTAWRWISRSRERVFGQSWIEQLDIRPRDLEVNFAHLSGGNQQKVVMGKWLGVDPRVLVLDEPSSGVDVAARAAIYEIVRERARAGLAVVVCSADIDELVDLAHRVIVLRGGQVVAELAGSSLNQVELLKAIEGGVIVDEDAQEVGVDE